MALTYQNIVDRAREFLNDPDKIAYSDSTLLTFAEQAVALLRVRRPDFFLGKLDTDEEETYPASLTDAIPIADKHHPALVYYVVGAAQMKDDEHVLAMRSASAFNMFSTITGVPVMTMAAQQRSG